MADFQIKIESIQGGHKPDYGTSPEGTYLQAVNIDPEGPGNSSSRIYSTGMITPVQSTDFSAPGGKLSAAPMWILTPGRDTNIYVYGYNGQVTRYDGLTLGTETVLSSSIGQSVGNGAAYYNNYLYFATSADVHRYGPLDGSPSMTLSAWTNTLGQPILSAACAYPATTIGGVTWPNHPMHVHVDNKLYIADFISATGKSCVSWISSAGDGTLPGAGRDALDIPFGYTITDIESFGNDLAILVIPIGKYSGGPVSKTGKAALLLWDGFSSSFYRQVDISDPMASAMVNHNGELRIFACGSGQRYIRLLGYTGSNSFRDLDYIYNTTPPLAGAVDVVGGMLAYGTTGITNATLKEYTGIMTYGTRNARTNPAARHMIMSPQTLQANHLVTALSFVDYLGRYPVIGSIGGTGSALTKKGTGTDMSLNGTSIFLGPFQFGQEFEITKIRFPFDLAISANSTVDLLAFIDDTQTSGTSYTISNSVYNGAKVVDLGVAYKGNYNIFFQINFSGTQAISINLPITIWGRTLRDN